MVALADARDPVALSAAVDEALGEPADITVVCVDVPGCEHGAILSGAGGTVIFFSMATSFSAAALGAEGLAADVTMLIGNGYIPGHADYALRPAAHEPAWRRCSPSGSPPTATLSTVDDTLLARRSLLLARAIRRRRHGRRR